LLRVDGMVLEIQSENEGKENTMSEILAQMKAAILACNAKTAADFAKRAIEEGVDVLNIADAATEAIRQIGDSYGRGEVWLPELIGGAGALKAVMSLIEEKLKKTGGKTKSLGKVLIGTVHGDLHSIGKDLVATLATAEGFQVIDLGVDVKGDVFIEAIRKHKPEIVAMSALLTTTALEQGKVVKMLKDEGLREKVKVVVGGGAITAGFSKGIGADGYEPTAPLGVKLFKKLLGGGE
jgi:5-methyltetrahydrofolate--homocysteine methyltransferase